jgi:hypothetical protein
MCPDCGFHASRETPRGPAPTVIAKLDEELDTMHFNWTQLLLQNLEDPTTKEAIGLLDAGKKQSSTTSWEIVSSRRISAPHSLEP